MNTTAGHEPNPIAALKAAADRAGRIAELYRTMAAAAEELESLGAAGLPTTFPAQGYATLVVGSPTVETGGSVQPGAPPVEPAGPPLRAVPDECATCHGGDLFWSEDTQTWACRDCTARGAAELAEDDRPVDDTDAEPPAPVEPPAQATQAAAPTPAASSTSPPPPAVLPTPPAHDPAAAGEPPAPHSSEAPAAPAEDRRRGGRHIKPGADGLFPRGREVLRSLAHADHDGDGWVMVNALARQDASSISSVKAQVPGLIAAELAEDNGRSTSARRYRITTKGLTTLGLEPRDRRGYPRDGEEDERPEPPPKAADPPKAPEPPAEPAPPASAAQTPPRPAAPVTKPTTVGETQAAIHAAIKDAPLTVPELSHGLGIPREAANAALNYLVQHGFAKYSPAGRRDGFQSFEAVRGRDFTPKP